MSSQLLENKFLSVSKSIMNLPKLTIGIPAYNEGANIKKLVRSVLDQKTPGFIIEKVIISSDGSTDNTAQVVSTIKDKRVVFINNKKREGIARGLNQIMKNSDSEILVTLDADIKIVNRNFLRRLITPIIDGAADLTSSSIKEIVPESKVANILNTSMRLKEVLFKVFKKGNNIYSCHGLARGYSRDFYSKLHFPVSIGNDMYSYLECLKKGFKFEYTPEARVYYRLPENINDHQKQSDRFYVAQTEMLKMFNEEFVNNELHIPYYVYVIAFFRAVPVILYYPTDSIIYFFLQLTLKLKPKSKKSEKQTWSIAVSSKKI